MAWAASCSGLMRSIECGYDILGEDDTIVSARASKTMRLIGKPKTVRGASLGVRAADIRLAFPRLPMSTFEDVLDYAASLFVHNIVRRGADVGVVDPADVPNPNRDLMWSHLDWHTQLPGSATPIVTAHVLTSKDKDATAQRLPMIIQRRSTTSAFLSDPLDTYDYLKLCWNLRQAAVPSDRRATTIFFAHTDGRPFSSNDVERCGKKIARAAGWPEDRVAKVGAKWGRIGGATDFRDVFGPSGRDLLRSRGRWGSDIDEIYSRTTAEELGTASARMGDSSRADLERLFPGWIQPGR